MSSAQENIVRKTKEVADLEARIVATSYQNSKLFAIAFHRQDVFQEIEARHWNAEVQDMLHDLEDLRKEVNSLEEWLERETKYNCVNSSDIHDPVYCAVVKILSGILLVYIIIG